MTRRRSTRSFALRVAGLMLALGVCVAYGFGWSDLIGIGRVERSLSDVLHAIPTSVGYLITGVLPFWYGIIIGWTLMATLAAVGMRALIGLVRA